MTHKNLEFWEWLFATYGTAGSPYTIESTLGGDKRVIFTADPENIKAILTTQFEDYGKGEPFHRDFKAFLGDSIFVTDGEQWSRNRQLIRPMFIRERVADLELFERHVVKLLHLLGGGGRVVDVESLFFRYTLDAATDFLLGKSVDSLDDPQAEFAEAFAEVQRVQNIIARAGYFHPYIPPYIPTSSSHRMYN
jgi:cytochrome P450